MIEGGFFVNWMIKDIELQRELKKIKLLIWDLLHVGLLLGN